MICINSLHEEISLGFDATHVALLVSATKVSYSLYDCKVIFVFLHIPLYLFVIVDYRCIIHTKIPT